MNAPRGPRDDLEIAVQLDSDGQLGEEELNALEVEGPALLVDSESEVISLCGAGQGKGSVLRLRPCGPQSVAQTPGGVQGEPTAPSPTLRPSAGDKLVAEARREPGFLRIRREPFHWVKENGTPMVVARLEDMV